MSSHHSSWNVSAYATTKETLVACIGQSIRPVFRREADLDRACDPLLREPNLSLNLEIAELINHKKANTPREAAVELVRLVNHRNAHLLDILVKNCGYPFHLQISTKDFLNELVRRFPERPPVFAPPPMAKILQLVHEWKNTLCVHSKHKEDLVHIRDMHRLLSYKGYRFPDFDKRAHSVLNPSEVRSTWSGVDSAERVLILAYRFGQTLQTPDELEEEDRAAQAAKLQELIRRGTPKDLAAAQELMKIMSGAEPEKRPDYEQQVQKELDRIQQRILLLNEMLNNAKPKERFVEGDAYDQIAQKCRHVQPKIQKWIEESVENDPGAIDRLLMMNDLINNILKRYESFKAGDRTAVAEIDPALGPSGGKQSKKVETSLIDFDFDEPRAGASNASPASSNPMDDLSALSGLSLGVGADSSSAFASGPTSAQPFGSQQGGQQPKVDPMSFFNSPSSSSSNTNSPRTLMPNSNNNGMGGGGGLFFSNPTYQQQQQNASSTSNGSGNSQPGTSNSPISWASPSTSNAIPRASTPSQPGVIQLGSGSGNGGNVSGGRSSLAVSTGKGGFGGQAMYGNSPPLPQLPMEANQEGGHGAGKKKDAFEDLLGDF
ncbi:BZ3500_MvSof-1268-A1-R1_Chr4-2g07059 [Microbotryum saponariae]|uniref:BZ3500_MvSof-1268-A1-R1_Chr4-2g07059 protein n=1 Tax=Microbotryum saponariae TaxID=289078 RepID=A0A2X0MY35_9BASI|nr:BZ3500_MvSof-1268-A1-R1_Chr4-2g07059 [Microbotryum saponariae]SDA06724.1 BZ3501_MvSof-1269-A2-R1_Chr4-2g06770 [Microbotryum saponariae]